MKKILFLSLFGLSVTAFSQIKTNGVVSENVLTNSSAFLDASSSPTWNGSSNLGKGLIFPRTDLTTLTALSSVGSGSATNYPTRMDGMVVYNTATGTSGIGGVAVTPGFYYYENKTTNLNGGTWKPFSSSVATGATNGNFWALAGNGGTTPVTVDPTTFAISGTGNYIGTTDAQNVVMSTNQVAKLTVGNMSATVGDATTPFNFVLDVYGKARFRDGIVTSASTYPDYVFDKYFTGKSEENAKYNFLTLAQTEKFIKENNHLPGVTSIKELTKANGAYEVDNTKLSIQTLEKVEELYLHTIEQQKQIDALKAEIAKLKAGK